MISPDVMLSYSWGQQPLVTKMKESISKVGFSVWMDTDQMYDKINDRMAEAVNGAKLVILCVSEKYENSVNCGKEYTYVDKLGKPFIPVYVQQNFQATKGKALDLIMGDKLYYNLYDEETFDSNISNLISGIRKMLNHDGIYIIYFSLRLKRE